MALSDTGAGHLWIEHRGDGPDVLLIGGLGDTVEAWQSQLEGLSDRYHLIAFDNRGTGRSPEPGGECSVAVMADDAAAVLGALDVPAAHIVGFSGGSLIGQEMALRHPDKVHSLVLVSTWLARPDVYSRAMANSWRVLARGAPDERAFLEAFYVWVYTPRAHEDGTVARIIDEVLAFPYKQSEDTFQRQLDAFMAFDSNDRVTDIFAPTLVLAGGLDKQAPPPFGRAVAEAIPGAIFEVLPEEAHQPFQEVPELFNARVDAFWRGLTM